VCGHYLIIGCGGDIVGRGGDSPSKPEFIGISLAGTAYIWTRQKSSYQGFFKEQNMKLSARNQLKGKIVEVTKGATTSHVRIDVGHGTTIMASITNEAVADLGLTKGDDAWAVIKASDVMIGK
jgi:molybdopterin-binding protein